MNDDTTQPWNEMVEVNYTIKAKRSVWQKIDLLLSVIAQCSRQGAGREIRIYIDGDGQEKISIDGLSPERYEMAEHALELDPIRISNGAKCTLDIPGDNDAPYVSISQISVPAIKKSDGSFQIIKADMK